MKLKRIIHAIAALSVCAGVSAENLSARYNTSEPLGTDVQKRIFSKLYDIELWSSSYPEKYDQDLTIRVVFSTRIPNTDVIEFLAEESQEIHDFSKTQLVELSTSMSRSITCDTKAGLTVDLNYIPKKGIIVTCDGVLNPVPIPDGPHAFFLLDVFLHSESEYTKLSLDHYERTKKL